MSDSFLASRLRCAVFPINLWIFRFSLCSFRPVFSSLFSTRVCAPRSKTHLFHGWYFWANPGGKLLKISMRFRSFKWKFMYYFKDLRGWTKKQWR